MLQCVQHVYVLEREFVYEGVCVYASMSVGGSEQRREMPRPAIKILLFSPEPFLPHSPPTSHLCQADIHPPTELESRGSAGWWVGFSPHPHTYFGTRGRESGHVH